MKCVMPHSSLEVHSNGEFGPCCLNPKRYADDTGKPFNVTTHSVDDVWKSQDRKNYAASLDAAYLDDCEICWQIEAQDGLSKRLLENTNTDRIISDHGPAGLDIKFSNVCNLRCTICGPQNSSQWYRDFEKLSGKKFDTTKYNWTRDVDMYNYFCNTLEHVRVLELYGGEPLLFKGHLDILRYCINHNYSAEQQLRLNTNGTVPITENHLAVYAEFKNVGMSWSIDSFNPAQFEYLRYPGNFHDMIANFEWVYANKPANIDINVTCTISTQNVYYAPDMIDFLASYPDVKLHFNTLTHPQALSINNISKTAANIIADKLSSKKVANYNGPNLEVFENQLRKCNAPNHNMFFNYINKLDSIRGNSFSEAFPEVSQILLDNN